jgi:PAS domain S-box-containing protein
VEEVGQGIYDQDGNALAIEGFVIDVTERRRAEEEIRKLNEELEDRVAERTARLESTLAELEERERILRESKERYQAVVEQAGEGIFLFDPETKRILETNPAFREMFGYGEEEVRSITLYDLVPRDKEGVDRNVERALRQGHLLVGERSYRRKDGTGIEVEVSGSVLSYGGKEVICSVVRDVTERKRAEDALRSSEARFRSLVEQSPFSIQILSPDGQTLRVNRAWEELFGVTLEKIEGYNILEDRQLVDKGVMPYILKGFAGEPIKTPPIAYVPETIHGVSEHGGQELWAQGFIYPIKDDAGNVHEVVLMHENVTERRRAEEALRESEERFRATFEQAAVGVAHVGPDGRWLRINDKLCEITGYPREELLGMSFQDITHPDDLQKDLDHLRRLSVGEIGTYFTEKRYIRKDRSVVWINLTTSAVGDTSGHLKYFITVVEDITERKKAEEALSQSEERYRAVVEQMTEGLFLFDAETKRILETNLAFQELLGYTSEELKRMRVYDLVPDDPESVDRNVRRNLTEGRLFVGERLYRRKDGSVADVEVGGNVISYGGREVLCAVARDITERKRAEQAIAEVREAERRRIARDLHDGVLQDLSYTAAAIEITKLQAQGTGLEEELRQEVDAIRNAVQGLRAAVHDLRLTDEFDRPFPRLVESLVERYRQMARGQQIRLEVKEGLPSAPLGQTGTEVLRVLQEALTNARRHSGAKGVLVSLRAEDKELVAEVSDDGRGFGPDTVAGVGLRSMRERAASLGGTLEVESGAGKGTRVRLRAPIQRRV